MNLPLYIAKRYLISKKSHHAINIVSGISVCGVALATAALVCTLSVFNGFQNLVSDCFTSFDPELKITARQGKVFDVSDSRIRRIREHPAVKVLTLSIEENAMARYKGKQATVTVKGVEDSFEQLTGIDSILYGRGGFMLHDEAAEYGIPGIQLTSILGTGTAFADALEVYAPKRNGKVNMANPSASFTRQYLFSAGSAFVVNQQKYDGSYILTSLQFARNLFEYSTHEASSVELKINEGYDTDRVQDEIRGILGPDFTVANRYEQQADIFRIMKIEKLISYLFLTFILMIACFNIIGSLCMLIIDKKEDAGTLRALGAGNRLIAGIFLTEGRMIAITGAVTGIISGLILCLIQQKTGILTLGGNSGSFIVNAYPVEVHAGDVILVFITVITTGFVSVWYPVRYLSRRLL